MRLKKIGLFVLVVAVCVLFVVLCDKFNMFPKQTYSGEDFGIETLQSPVDFNENGTDDYTDILLGARIDAKNHPKYDGSYYSEGYPPDNIGVCTDVVWRAFKNAGYCLRDMVDADIQLRPNAYPNIETRDINIDFRRVQNLRVFFEKYAENLTTDIEDISQWQGGDIVIFGDDNHIGIVSDKRTEEGIPYIIHNGGQPKREEDYIKRTSMEITGHYRFNAEAVDNEMLIAWHD